MLAGELVIVKQGDGGIEIAFQMACSMMLVVSAAVAVEVAAVKHMYERRESSCGHELLNIFGSVASPRLSSASMIFIRPPQQGQRWRSFVMSGESASSLSLGAVLEDGVSRSARQRFNMSARWPFANRP